MDAVTIPPHLSQPMAVAVSLQFYITLSTLDGKQAHVLVLCSGMCVGLYVTLSFPGHMGVQKVVRE